MTDEFLPKPAPKNQPKPRKKRSPSKFALVDEFIVTGCYGTATSIKAARKLAEGITVEDNNEASARVCIITIRETLEVKRETKTTVKTVK